VPDASPFGRPGRTAGRLMRRGRRTRRRVREGSASETSHLRILYRVDHASVKSSALISKDANSSRFRGSVAIWPSQSFGWAAS
jgi:hypothetical protein